MKLLKVIIVFYFLTPIYTLSAQGSDTVHSRRATFFLADSTKIAYEMCWIALNQGSGRHFLAFADTTSNIPNNYYQTALFQATGSDTLAFNRFVDFDDKNYLRPFLLDTTDHTAFTAQVNAIDSTYRGKEITPISTYFNGSSTVIFVLQLCKAFSGIVIANIDTLECFENLSGDMRYENFPASFNIREKIALSGTVADSSYYFKVLRVDNLPSGSSYIGYLWEEYPQNTGAELYYTCQYQVGYPTPLKIDDVSNLNLSDQKAFMIQSLEPNPTSGNLAITLILPRSSEVTINVYDVAGRLVYARSALVAKGNSIFSIALPPLPSGQYLLEAGYGGFISSKNFVIFK